MRAEISDPSPPRPHVKGYLPASAVLEILLTDAPQDYVTLEWLMAGLHERSFGIVMLLLGLVALIPGLSTVAGIVLAIPAFEMILGRPRPVFPRWILSYRLPHRRLAVLFARAIPLLKYLERLIYPRRRPPFAAAQRVVGLVILLLCATLLVPIPLSNLPPAAIILLISLALIEDDGVLLAIALVAALALIAAVSLAIWEAAHATMQIGF
jgi:hypothetical protein